MDELTEQVREAMEFFEKGNYNTGNSLGMTPEELIKTYPKIVLEFMKIQQMKISDLELKIEQLELKIEQL